MNGMIVMVPVKVTIEPSAPRMPIFLSKKPRSSSVPKSPFRASAFADFAANGSDAGPFPDLLFLQNN